MAPYAHTLTHYTPQAVEGRSEPFEGLPGSAAAAGHGAGSSLSVSAAAFIGGGTVLVAGSAGGHLVARALPKAARPSGQREAEAALGAVVRVIAWRAGWRVCRGEALLRKA